MQPGFIEQLITMLVGAFALLVSNPLSGGLTAWFSTTFMIFFVLPLICNIFLSMFVKEKNIPQWLRANTLANMWWRVFSFPFVLAWQAIQLLGRMLREILRQAFPTRFP